MVKTMLKEIITKWLGEEKKKYKYPEGADYMAVKALEDLKSRIPELEEMIEKKVSIEWEDTKDEMYTYFGKCECGANSVIVGSKYCNECGSLIKNTLKGVK